MDTERGDMVGISIVMGALEAREVPLSEGVREELRQAVRKDPAGVTERPDDFAALVAMNVRNALERFHAADEDERIEGLDDAAMARVNPAVRRAIYEVIVAVNAAASGDTEAARKLRLLAQMVSSEWEPASELPESGVF